MIFKQNPSLPSRTALLITVFLLLINMFAGVVTNTPNTSTGGKGVDHHACFSCVLSHD